jgi:hypothetical protein
LALSFTLAAPLSAAPAWAASTPAPVMIYNGARLEVGPGCKFTLSAKGQARFICTGQGRIRLLPLVIRNS